MASPASPGWLGTVGLPRSGASKCEQEADGARISQHRVFKKYPGCAYVAALEHRLCSNSSLKCLGTLVLKLNTFCERAPEKVNFHSCSWLARSLTQWAREMHSGGTSEAGYRIRVGVLMEGN